MIRVLVSLCKAVSLVAADGQAGASSPPTEAFSRPAINCEQPAYATAVTAPRAEVDIGSILRQFTTHTETLSQMEAWWRERTDLHAGIPAEPSSSAMKETIAQMETWWTQRGEPGRGAANKPAPTSHHRRSRQRSTPVIEYGCPPSVCTIQYGNQ